MGLARKGRRRRRRKADAREKEKEELHSSAKYDEGVETVDGRGNGEGSLPTNRNMPTSGKRKNGRATRERRNKHPFGG